MRDRDKVTERDPRDRQGGRDRVREIDTETERWRERETHKETQRQSERPRKTD